MDPTLKLHTDVDVLKHSPMLRGMFLTLDYAEEHGGIGLTKSDAMNRKFVHWAAAAFNWPGTRLRNCLDPSSRISIKVSGRDVLYKQVGHVTAPHHAMQKSNFSLT